ncbi:molybdopterin-dependent oxidoreductase [Octadecabacter sp. G9-8]|uniref:Molybdopterin-dependent oxidoreductase n=1 Tax=Octadecabacter dasysiphoniae TaxID=2909341 RepID=A0ABS9CV02_9RHOB|nr:molybdopterin-dependent oxidoreductase [Octadecabacter dasysiphoniae]MCF2869853.1 molybdopterin-dependent oxidoreductase [Octadecabacter dasysiphoniae]
MLMQFVHVSLGAVLAVGLSQSAMAQDSASTLLTISGEITLPSGDDTLSLDLDALMDLPVSTFETSTIWTDGVHSFTGVSLADLAEELGIEDGQFIATAINDYAVEIPLSDAVEGGPIIAYLMDGEEMTVRDKGPLWVIYPYDSDAEYRSEVVYSRSIWQLDRLEAVQ